MEYNTPVEAKQCLIVCTKTKPRNSDLQQHNRYVNIGLRKHHNKQQKVQYYKEQKIAGQRQKQCPK